MYMIWFHERLMKLIRSLIRFALAIYPSRAAALTNDMLVK